MGGLGLSLNGLIAQLVNFGILLVFVYFIGYKPIQKMLNERSKRIKEGIESSERAKKRAEEAEQEFKKHIEEARGEGQSIISQAEGAASRIRGEAKESAKRDAEAIVERAREEIRRERDEAIDLLRREFADTSIRAAERVINQSLDKERHRKIIDDTIEESPILRRGEQHG